MVSTSLRNLYFRPGLLSGVHPARIHIFQQKSNAKSVLLHHDDIQDFLQVRFYTHPSFPLTLVQGDEEKMSWLLSESRITDWVKVDENGSRPRPNLVNYPWIFTLYSWTAESYNNWIPGAYFVGFRN